MLLFCALHCRLIVLSLSTSFGGEWTGLYTGMRRLNPTELRFWASWFMHDDRETQRRSCDLDEKLSSPRSPKTFGMLKNTTGMHISTAIRLRFRLRLVHAWAGHLLRSAVLMLQVLRWDEFRERLYQKRTKKPPPILGDPIRRESATITTEECCVFDGSCRLCSCRAAPP
jgi:hypothetical protein